MICSKSRFEEASPSPRGEDPPPARGNVDFSPLVEVDTPTPGESSAFRGSFGESAADAVPLSSSSCDDYSFVAANFPQTPQATRSLSATSGRSAAKSLPTISSHPIGSKSLSSVVDRIDSANTIRPAT
jgi:hypothetical protein